MLLSISRFLRNAVNQYKSYLSRAATVSAETILAIIYAAARAQR